MLTATAHARSPPRHLGRRWWRRSRGESESRGSCAGWRCPTATGTWRCHSSRRRRRRATSSSRTPTRSMWRRRRARCTSDAWRRRRRTETRRPTRNRWAAGQTATGSARWGGRPGLRFTSEPRAAPQPRSIPISRLLYLWLRVWEGDAANRSAKAQPSCEVSS
eukprot:7221421-Prymnesium_polylepis.1